MMKQNQAEIFNAAIGFVETSKIEMDVAWMRENFSKIKANSPSARIRLASEIAASLAKTDVEGSLRWAATLPPDHQVGANNYIFSQWLKQDPTAASAWLTTWPDGNAKNDAIKNLVYNILEEDPEAAVKWAANLQTNDRFPMMNEALNYLATKEPSAAERARQSLSEADRAALAFWGKKNN